MSGGRSYGKRSPKYSRQMKYVFKTAAFAVIGKENEFNDFYNQLLQEKSYAPHTARNAVARRIAHIALGVLKSEKSLNHLRRVTECRT